MKARVVHMIAFLLVLSVGLSLVPPQAAAAQPKEFGMVMILSVFPKKVCVGDTITINATASIGTTQKITPPLAWLPVTTVRAGAALGKVTPEQVRRFNNGFNFNITYKATTPGSETITLVVNDNIASASKSFEVEEKCGDYDAFYTSVMHFTSTESGEEFSSITHVAGTGTMKRDREGSQYLQGDGTWHLEEILLTKPAMCVEYYAPPLIVSGPFELDGKYDEENDSVDVILQFLPDMSKSFYYGEVVCVDEDGEVGTGWGNLQGGDPSLASKVEATFLSGGGTQSVELEGAGIEIVKSVGELDYFATLTLIPR